MTAATVAPHHCDGFPTIIELEPRAGIVVDLDPLRLWVCTLGLSRTYRFPALRAHVRRHLPEAGKCVYLPAMRAYSRCALQSKQALQDLQLNHAHHGPAFVAPEFHVGPFDGGDDATAAIDASTAVRNDGHPVGEFAAQFAVHSPFLTQRQVCAQYHMPS